MLLRNFFVVLLVAPVIVLIVVVRRLRLRHQRRLLRQALLHQLVVLRLRLGRLERLDLLVAGRLLL